jgi:anti-sigma B factor antagonist
MNIVRHVEGAGSVRLALAGELDLSTVDQLHWQVKHEWAAQPLARLVIDLAETAFCDPTGVGALIESRDAAVACGVAFLVINPSGMTRRVMDVTGVLSVLTSGAEPG